MTILKSRVCWIIILMVLIFVVIGAIGEKDGLFHALGQVAIANTNVKMIAPYSTLARIMDSSIYRVDADT